MDWGGKFETDTGNHMWDQVFTTVGRSFDSFEFDDLSEEDWELAKEIQKILSNARVFLKASEHLQSVNFPDNAPQLVNAYSIVQKLVFWLKDNFTKEHELSSELERKLDTLYSTHVENVLVQTLCSTLPYKRFVGFPASAIISLPKKESGKLHHPSVSEFYQNLFAARVYLDDDYVTTNYSPLPHDGASRRIILYFCHLFNQSKQKKAIFSLGKSKRDFYLRLGFHAQGSDYHKLDTHLNSLLTSAFVLSVPNLPWPNSGFLPVKQRFFYAQGSTGFLNNFYSGKVKYKDQRVARFFHQLELWDSENPHVLLSPYFCYRLIDDPLLIDFNAVKKLGSNPQKLDFYVFLVDRLHRLPKYMKEVITWESLSELLTTKRLSGKGLSHFKNRFLKGRKVKGVFIKGHFESVLEVYPQARVEVGKRGLILRRSPPPIKLPE